MRPCSENAEDGIHVFAVKLRWHGHFTAIYPPDAGTWHQRSRCNAEKETKTTLQLDRDLVSSTVGLRQHHDAKNPHFSFTFGPYSGEFRP
jgi:hypothetical protein